MIVFSDILSFFFETIGDDTLFLVIALFYMHAIITSLFYVYFADYRHR